MNKEDVVLVKSLSGDDKSFEPESKVCVSLFRYGCKDRGKIAKYSGVSGKRFNSIWKNLKDSAYFDADGSILLDALQFWQR